MGPDAQADFAILTVIGSCSQGRTHVSFEHAENGFDLPTLAIGFLGESLLHQLAISSAHRAGLAIKSRSPAIRAWDDTANAQFVATETMESLGFASGVPQEGRETLGIQSFVQGRFGFHRIGLRPAKDARERPDHLAKAAKAAKPIHNPKSSIPNRQFRGPLARSPPNSK